MTNTTTQIDTIKPFDINSRQAYISRIEIKRYELQQAKEKLNNYFVGLEEVIDKLIKNIEPWYVMPELIQRPCIICLWGMTGVGKTDLIRRLIRELNLSQKFLEVQMSNKGVVSTSGYSSNKTIRDIICNSDIEPDSQSVLLLDEFQRFRTLDEQGSEIHDYNLQDVWALLSDGKFSNTDTAKLKLHRLLFETLYDMDTQEYKAAKAKLENKKDSNGESSGQDDDTSESDFDDLYEEDEYFSESGEETLPGYHSKISNVKRKYQRCYHTARSLKTSCRLKESIEEIMTWDADKRFQVIKKRIDDQDVYEGEDFSKMLIFISGNLDEAYSMHNECGNADFDADSFYEYTKRINLIDIKNSLKRRFKAEQIARLGNNHIIYTSLSKQSFIELIDRQILSICDRIKQQFGITISVDESVKKAIYRNGVFPVQGTRPLFSTINTYFEAVIPEFLLEALMIEQDAIYINYKEKHYISQVGDKTYKIKNEGEIDKIKNNKFDLEKNIAVSVHESFHALTYTLLFKRAPRQINVNLSSSDGGFVAPHEPKQDYVTLKNLLMVDLAPYVGDQIVFGSDARSAGVQADLLQATKRAASMIRKWGMGNSSISHIGVEKEHGLSVNSFNNNILPSNDEIEKILKETQKELENLLIHHLEVIHALSKELIENFLITPERYKQIMDEFNIECKIETNDVSLINYTSIYESKFGPLNKDKINKKLEQQEF